MGYKSAGETDVFEAIEHVKANYNIDANRIALMGFSMGGAGAWHLGAHYADQFVAVSPGAGFAETAKYQKLSEAQIKATPWYERRLWNLYDCPSYVSNFFNIPTVVCYSGEKDKQMQAARVMEVAFAERAQDLDHVIGPGMGHKYDDNSLAEILKKVGNAVKAGRPSFPEQLSFQTQTLKYPRMYWLNVERLEEHWQDSRVDAKVERDRVEIFTKNVRQLSLHAPRRFSEIVIDGVTLAPQERDLSIVISRSGKWQLGPLKASRFAKKPGLQGPIDDAFTDRFLVVTPDREIPADDVDQKNLSNGRISNYSIFGNDGLLYFGGRSRKKRPTK